MASSFWKSFFAGFVRSALDAGILDGLVAQAKAQIDAQGTGKAEKEAQKAGVDILANYVRSKLPAA